MSDARFYINFRSPKTIFDEQSERRGAINFFFFAIVRKSMKCFCSSSHRLRTNADRSNHLMVKSKTVYFGLERRKFSYCCEYQSAKNCTSRTHIQTTYPYRIHSHFSTRLQSASKSIRLRSLNPLLAFSFYSSNCSHILY